MKIPKIEVIKTPYGKEPNNPFKPYYETDENGMLVCTANEKVRASKAKYYENKKAKMNARKSDC